MSRQTEQREMEMARGAQIAQRAAREDLLNRYQSGKRMTMMVALCGHPLWEDHGRVNLYYVDEVMVFHENTDSDAHPSDALMATLALAIGATTGLDNLPATPPSHHVGGKEYNRQLRERNKGRVDFA